MNDELVLFITIICSPYQYLKYSNKLPNHSELISIVRSEDNRTVVMIEWLQFYLFMLPVAELIVTLFASVFFDGIGSGVIGIIIIGVLYKHNLALTATRSQ